MFFIFVFPLLNIHALSEEREFLRKILKTSDHPIRVSTRRLLPLNPFSSLHPLLIPDPIPVIF